MFAYGSKVDTKLPSQGPLVQEENIRKDTDRPDGGGGYEYTYIVWHVVSEEYPVRFGSQQDHPAFFRQLICDAAYLGILVNPMQGDLQEA